LLPRISFGNFGKSILFPSTEGFDVLEVSDLDSDLLLSNYVRPHFFGLGGIGILVPSTASDIDCSPFVFLNTFSIIPTIPHFFGDEGFGGNGMRFPSTDRVVSGFGICGAGIGVGLMSLLMRIPPFCRMMGDAIKIRRYGGIFLLMIQK
jgi:hypothetical protein